MAYNYNVVINQLGFGSVFLLQQNRDSTLPSLHTTTTNRYVSPKLWISFEVECQILVDFWMFPERSKRAEIKLQFLMERGVFEPVEALNVKIVGDYSVNRKKVA